MRENVAYMTSRQNRACMSAAESQSAHRRSKQKWIYFANFTTFIFMPIKHAEAVNNVNVN